MSSKFRWLALYGFILLCAFAFGVGYGMAYNEAWAERNCDCTKYCPTTDDYEPAKQWPPSYECDFDPINCFDCVLPK